MTPQELGVLTAGIVTFLNLYATQALLPTLAVDFHVPLAQTGLTVTASLVAVAAVAPFVGTISDALGRRRLILGAALLVTLPTLAAAAAPTLGFLVAARFAQGLLLPFIFAVTVAYIAEECPGPAALRPTSLYSIGTTIGGFAGRFVAGWTADFLGWRAAFAVLAALTLAGTAIIALSLPRERNFIPIQGWRRSLAGFNDHFRNPQVLATCAVGFAVLFSVVATFTYANFLLAAPPYGLGPAQLGSVFIVYLVAVVGTPLATRLARRIGRAPTVLLGALAIAAGLAITLAPNLWSIIAGLALVAAGIFVQQTLSIGYVAFAARTSRSTAVGLYVTSYYLGGSLGGILPAGIWSHFGWPGCVALVALVQTAAMTLTWLVWPRNQALR